MQVWSLGWEDPLEEDTATHSSILAWRIPWTEEHGGLQSTGSQRVYLTQLKQLSLRGRMHIHTHKYRYTYTFKYQLPSKLDEVIRGTNVRGVTPLCLALCKALYRQRWIKQGLVYPEHSIWQQRRGRHRIHWNNNVITDLPVKGQRCQGPKSRKWVMPGVQDSEGAKSGHPGQGPRANWDQKVTCQEHGLAAGQEDLQV